MYEKLLIECLKSESGDDLGPILKKYSLNAPDTDWKAIARKGARSMPLVYNVLKKHAVDIDVPEEISEAVKFQCVNGLWQTEQIKRDSIELADKFNSVGIASVLLKGAAFLFTIYGDDPGMRTMADIDILVNKRDLPEAERVLTELGYAEDYDRVLRSEHVEVSRKFFTEHNYHYIYFRGDTCVELHWNIMEKRDTAVPRDIFLDAEKVFEKDVPITVSGPCFSLFIACVNFVKDFRLRFTPDWYNSPDEREKVFSHTVFVLMEIRRIIRYYGNKLSWEKVFFQARQAGMIFEVCSLIYLADEVLNAGMPANIARKIKRVPSIRFYAFLCRNVPREDITCLLLLLKVAFNFSASQLFSKRLLSRMKEIYGSILAYAGVYDRRCYSALRRAAGVFKLAAGKK